MEAFNSFDDSGRVCCVLLHAQHSCEMLLKGILAQKRLMVFDQKSGKSISFQSALQLCVESCNLAEGEAATMKVINSLRNSEQHWFTIIGEDFLYLHLRALITVFDDYLKRSLEIDLHSKIPARVLPISTKPPGDFDFLIDREFKLIKELLRPGNRRRDEARARIRSLLAMEALTADETDLSEKDIDRIEKAVKLGVGLDRVFPRLIAIALNIDGDGPNLKVTFTKKEGVPIKFVSDDGMEEAAAVREVDLQRKYYLSPADLAKKLGLSLPRTLALRRYLKIDSNGDCHKRFMFGKTKHDRFSDNAVRKMKLALNEKLNMDEVWDQYNPSAWKRKTMSAKV